MQDFLWNEREMESFDRRTLMRRDAKLEGVTKEPCRERCLHVRTENVGVPGWRRTPDSRERGLITNPDQIWVKNQRKYDFSRTKCHFLEKNV